jgi:hypothetical protein
MSADRKSAPRGGSPAEPPRPVEAETAEPETAEPSPVALNRAERRGRAKRGSRPEVAGRGKVAGRSSAAPSPRMWTNRRGGG